MKKLLFAHIICAIPNVVNVTFSQNNNELYVNVPLVWQNIIQENNKWVYYGLKDLKDIPQIDGYNTISLVSKIQILQSLAKSYKDNRLDNIVRIDYQPDSCLEKICSGSISGLCNLTHILFPSSIKTIEKKAIVNCPKLNELDFSAFEKDQSFISPLIFDMCNISQISISGTIYVNNQKVKSLVEAKFHSVKAFANWNIVIK